MKRSFSLIEVLVSVSLFFVALTFILPPMQKAAHMISHDREELQAQSAVEEAVHAFHASLFQYDPFTYDQLLESMKEKEVHGFTIAYKIVEKLSDQESTSQVHQLTIALTASKDSEKNVLAQRRVYVCVKTV